jgi:hypothetical protein
MPNRIGERLARRIFLAAVFFSVGGAAPFALDPVTQDHLPKCRNYLTWRLLRQFCDVSFLVHHPLRGRRG